MCTGCHGGKGEGSRWTLRCKTEEGEIQRSYARYRSDQDGEEKEEFKVLDPVQLRHSVRLQFISSAEEKKHKPHG